MPMADMLKKLRAYYHFVKRPQRHKEAFGVHPMRAVLIATVDESRARKLMDLVKLPAVIGESKRSSLFWFAISPLFTAAQPTGSATLTQMAEAHAALGDMFVLMGRPSDAKTSYLRALAVQPGLDSARKGLEALR